MKAWPRHLTDYHLRACGSVCELTRLLDPPDILSGQRRAGNLLYDADGAGGVAAIRVGTLVTGTELSASDIWAA